MSRMCDLLLSLPLHAVLSYLPLHAVLSYLPLHAELSYLPLLSSCLSTNLPACSLLQRPSLPFSWLS